MLPRKSIVELPSQDMVDRIQQQCLASAGEQLMAAERIFEMLRDKKSERVLISKLLTTFESVGIRPEDPRLALTMRQIYQFQKASLKDEETAKKSFYLDKLTFCELIRSNSVIIHRVLENDFVVPEFSEMCGRLDEIFNMCREDIEGKVADYIPQLARFSPDLWGMSLCTIDGQRYSNGDSNINFCLQSTSKPLNYALAHTENRSEVFHKFIGYEPSGVSFNSICLNKDNKPHNPMINAGAIITASLIRRAESLADRFDYVIQQYRRMAGGEYIGFSNSTFLSERATADRNYALAYFMKENKCFPSGALLEETMDFYFQLCSVEITCDSGAVIAATLANGGICPLTGERVVNSDAVRDTLSLMYSCGMYDYSGQFAFRCGLPGKSGVSGVILLVIPNVMGMCLWSPPLDRQGNSARGIAFCEELVRRFNFHNYDSLVSSQDKYDPRRHSTETKSQEVVTLIFSACNNDITALRRAFLKDIAMGQCDYDGRTALHVAAAEGHLECVKFLVNTCKVDPNPQDRWNFTPLGEAVKFGNKDVADFLKDFCKLNEPIEGCGHVPNLMKTKREDKSKVVENCVNDERKPVSDKDKKGTPSVKPVDTPSMKAVDTTASPSDPRPTANAT